ncbi:MAG TPA: cysteine peptidase family C39 domain-containing protein [Sedimentisphaerales bacterium]|nr:cysteine peptidase family C39 domain-containing protein [Sedimentisphaerales bacterium]
MTTAVVLVLSAKAKTAQLESWQSCCGAVCLRTVGGLLGTEVPLGEIRELLRSNSRGQVSFAEIAEAAEKMGLHAAGVRINSQRIEECAFPMIAHWPPNHFLVLLGLGKNRGVTVIDPPRAIRKMTRAELASRDHFNVLCISKHPLPVHTYPIGQPRADDQLPDQPGPPTIHGGLQFDDPLWYFGDVRPGTTKKHEFSFTNIASEPLAIVQLKPDCPCLKVKHFTENIAPGERGKIEVLIDTSGLIGHITKRIVGIASTRATNTHKSWFFLKIAGQVSKTGELLLEPACLYLGDTVKGSITCESVSLRRIGYDPLYLKSIEPTSPMISVNRIQGIDPNTRVLHLEVRVEANNALGALEEDVVFHTYNPHYPSATLHISGNIVPHISVEPPEVFLGLLSKQRPLNKNIIVRSRTATPFEIRSASTTLDGIVGAVFPTDYAKTSWQITLTNSAALQRGIIEGKIVANTNDSDLPKLEIPFTALVAQ